MYQQPTTFESLPFDIHVEVARHLNYQEILCLKATNHYFYTVLNPRAVLGMRQIRDFVTERDDYLRRIGHELFACNSCFKFLPKKKFEKIQNFYSPQSFRVCLDCTAAWKTRRHLSGTSCAGRTLRYYFCRNCGQCRTKSEKCRGKQIEYDFTTDEIAEALSLCTPPRRQRRSLEKLPTHILKKVSSFLGFLDVLRLAQVSRDLDNVIKPNQWVALHTRYLFVRDKWANDMEDSEPSDANMFPCYLCFKIHPQGRFRYKQIQLSWARPETAWKMRCEACVWLMGRSAMSLKRIEYRRRETCQICGCIKYSRATCGGCMELYVQGSIGWQTIYPNGAERAEGQFMIGSLFNLKDEPAHEG
ncbi:hypothetical protein FGRMN_6345 [Fusarium graminum]|nr:hypothetical protein FGRMN_6345 [Fusarium graminum]